MLMTIDMSTTGTKELNVSYEYNGQQMEGSVTITSITETTVRIRILTKKGD